MYTFITLGAAALFFLIIFIITVIIFDDDVTVVGTVSFVFSIFLWIALICCSISLINKNARFERIIEDYNITKQLVENYVPGVYANSQSIIEKTIELNEIIVNHKTFSKSKWTNLWYSEKVGNLEPLYINFNKTNKEDTIIVN